MRRFSILVVDDDPDIVMILKDNLSLDGYRVTTASTGREAMDLFQPDGFDLVLLDLMLPDFDGVQVCRSLRDKASMPIVLLTAKDRLSDKVLGLESGADDYVVKPFDYLELAARIRALLRRSYAYNSSPCPQVAGCFSLVPQSRTVSMNGRTIGLTKKEFDLLALLIRHAGQVMDRDTIRRHLWPDDGIYKWSRAIDVHIQHLRAKLEEDAENPRFIQTIQGVGYLLKTS